MTPAEYRVIVCISKGNRIKTAPEIAAKVIRRPSKPINVTIAKRRLGKTGLCERVVEEHTSILESNMVSSGLQLADEDFTFEFDNGPKHTTRICRDYLQEEQSLHLNSIELLYER
ncbi:hypothetical protein Trydic_g7467 [Trypoxylus dichotomus]